MRRPGIHTPLHRHPATPCACASTLTVAVDWISRGRLSFDYRIGGDVTALELPARQSPKRRDRLWRSTCFEAFIRSRDERGYFELNFSPSTEWAIYWFDHYRHGMGAVAPKHAPGIDCRRDESGLIAHIDLHVDTLGLAAGGNLELGLAAVLQDRTGALSYWALAHPTGQPDFHDPRGFVLTLGSPSL